MQKQEKQRAVFLDRDGTINVEKDYLYQISDFEYMDGALEGLKELSDMGYLLVVVTNQSGIARGYYKEQDYLNLEKWMCEDLRSKGIPIARCYFCPHLPDGVIPEYSIECECRKPKTGMYWKAAKELGLDMDKCFAVGDKPRDLSICKESGVTGLLLSDNSKEARGRTIYEDSEYIICRNWNEIIHYIKSGSAI